MKLFLKAIALAAKEGSTGGPRSLSAMWSPQSSRDELNRLIDVAESSGLVVWHDDFCFKSTFWDWGNRETGNINWGGYGSSYKPANESYFKFQYPSDTVYANGSKLIIRKGAKPLDSAKAPRATIRSIFRKCPPPVTGDGLTDKKPWEFPLSRMQGEGIAMAHELMRWKGPEYRLRRQSLVQTDDETELLEYWDTDAGRFWFRYRKDPRLDLIGS